ncbi:hypothetical protein MLD38_011658 [Melastoma candidum]|uniref:Uncharacterized protein n=1 Tax=Melastoma candidum TaxID=119954 RepID=A0ACB9R5G6_9MYRT|nr:hypothetical protein MLD38_011658 [Melastoma candidum]
MTSSNLPGTIIKDDDARRKRPHPAGSNSCGEDVFPKKGRKVGPVLPDKLQQTPPSATVTRTERLNKRTPSPLERSMSSQEGPSPSSERQGASTSSKLQASKRMREEEEKKIKESRQCSIGNSRRKSAISARSYMECFIEQRKNIKLASLEELTSPCASPVILNSYELSKKALDDEENSQSSNQFNLENQVRCLRDTDKVSGHSKLDAAALSNEKEVVADLTGASDLEEDALSPKEVSQFSGSSEVKMPLDVHVSRQRDPEVRDDSDSNSRCDSREPFEGNSINPTVEKKLTASGEPETVSCSENGKCNNNREGLGPEYIDDAVRSDKLLLWNNCNRSCHQSSLIPSSADAAPGVLHCPACVGHKEEFSRFVEYWVPALISNVQLEQYCEMLLSNALALSSSSRSCPVGALHDILISIRKCCDHPFIVDTKLPNLLSKDVPATDYLDIGIKASGKLVLLDKLLHELKKQKMRVLVLFQHIGGCLDTTGDILDDYMRQRFGEDSYERIDGGVMRSRVMAALNLFNQIEQGRFVLLLEKRACSPRIKLSSIDVVIIFDSDWNPINDLRNLQKLSWESELKQVKVFRLYSPFTVEEKVLVCAKQGTTWDSKLLSANFSSSQMLLMWGASYLLKKLEEFHSISKMSYISDSDKKLTENVVQEFLTLLESSREETIKSNCFITKVQVDVVGYTTEDLLQGESSLQLEYEESPHMFWSRLRNRKILRWKYILVSSQRNRKKVKPYDQVTTKSGKAQKKDQRKLINQTKALPPENPGIEEGMPANKEGIVVSPCSSLPGKDHLLSPDSRNVEQDERTKLIDAQRSLHVDLKQEITRLSEILELSDDVRVVVEIFFDYVINNRHLPRESATILQAFQLALCWTSASLLKEKIDRRVSLELSQRHLSFSCSREEADCVYMRLRNLKKLFLATLESSDSIDSSKAPELLTKVAKLNRSSDKTVHLAAASHDVSAETASAASGAACCSSGVLTSHKARDGKQLNGCVDNPRKTVDLQPCVEMKRKGISRDIEAEKASLEKSYQLEIAIIRLHHTGSKLKEKLEMLKIEHDKKLKEVELYHSTTENHFQRESQSFSVQGDRHSYDQIPHPEENNEEIDSATGKSTDQRTRINVHDIDNSDSEISRASSSPQALASKSSSKAAPLQNEENETADSGSTSGIAKGASKVLRGGAGIETNHQENAYSRNSCLGEVGLAKERSEEAVKDVLPGVSEPLLSKENTDSTSDDLLMSRTSNLEVLVEEPVTVSNVMESFPSNAVPPRTSALPGIEALQYDQGRESLVGDCHTANNHTSAICSAGDGSGILLPDEPGRATTSNVPSASRDEVMSPNPISDACEDLHHEVTSTRECLLNAAPGTFSDFSEEDGNGRIQEQQDNMLEREVESPQPCILTSSAMEERIRQPPELLNLQQREPEAPYSQKDMSSENDGAQMEPVLREEISGDVSPSKGPPNIAPAGALENQLLGDAVLSRTMPTGSQGPCNSHLPPTRTSSLPISNSPLGGALCSRGAPVGSTFVPNRRPMQPLIQHAPGMPLPSREADPLENEFEMMRKEVVHADQTFDELKSRLIFERDKEIQEMFAQIHTKFEDKLKEAETEHDLKKEELDLHMNRVFMNKMLAAAFRHKCKDIKSSTLRGGQRARNFQRQASVPSSHVPPPSTSQGSAIPPSHSQSIPPAVLNPQNRAPAGPPINHAPPHSPRVPAIPLLKPVSLSVTLSVPTMVGHTFPVEQTRAIAPHLQHPRPGGRPILSQQVQDLVNRHVNLTTNVPSAPAMRTTNQVTPSAMASQIWNVVPGPSDSSTNVVCLSDEK